MILKAHNFFCLQQTITCEVLYLNPSIQSYCESGQWIYNICVEKNSSFLSAARTVQIPLSQIP